jgi:hypothetical protein
VPVNSLRTRALIGLAIFALMVIVGVLLSAGGGHATHGSAPSPPTDTRPLSAAPAHDRAADALHPQPNPRSSRRPGGS